MKVSRTVLERIVYEEFVRFLAENLNEAPSVAIAGDDEEERPVPDPSDAPEEPTGMPEMEPPEIPGGDEVADDELDQELAGDAAPPGSIASELHGKTLESIEMDEDSKMMPGATEVVLTFKETADALRIMITKTGRVKFFFRGLHNTLGDPEGAEGTEGSDEEDITQTQAPDDIGDVPDGDSTEIPDTPRPPHDDEDEDEEEIEI